MSNYFQNFNAITYKQQVALNIAQRVVIPKDLRDSPFVYLPYTIQEGDTPELVSYYYYDSVDLVWLVYFANGVIDPATDWLMDTNIFHKYLIKKYEGPSNKKGTKVLDWLKNETIAQNIVFYRRVDDPHIKITHQSYLLDPTIQAEDWECVRLYQYEFEANEAKRTIRLVNKEYADQFQTALGKALNE